MPTYKLTDHQVKVIREMAAFGVKQEALGKMFNVTTNYISFLVNERRRPKKLDNQD